MCMCLARGCVGGEGLGLGFTNPVEIVGVGRVSVFVLRWCWLGVGRGLGTGSGICVEGRYRYLYIVLGGYLRIFGAPSLQFSCTLSVSTQFAQRFVTAVATLPLVGCAVWSPSCIINCPIHLEGYK